MKLKNLALLGTSIFSLVPAFAMAQDIAEEEIITVTGTRSVRLATDVVGNQASVSGSEIEFLSPTHINEALQGIAGANISRN
ncbi:MAG: hypothetical protein HN572_07620, partial [Kordiimonadaceae bacterium]|nr:hypothetical protein [Kordiimonadaceae bacterium]